MLSLSGIRWNANAGRDEPSHLTHEAGNDLNIRRSSIHRQWGLRLKASEAFANTSDRSEIPKAIRALCAEFDDVYWADKDLKHEFPFEFAAALADGGWLGIAMPPEFGGSGLGVTEAAEPDAAWIRPKSRLRRNARKMATSLTVKKYCRA